MSPPWMATKDGLFTSRISVQAQRRATVTMSRLVTQCLGSQSA